MSVDEEMDEPTPFLDVAEFGSLGAVTFYRCTKCGNEEYAEADQEPAKVLVAPPCPKCGGETEIGMRDLATELNEFFGAYRDGLEMLDMIEERIPDAKDMVAEQRAQLEAAVEKLRGSVGSDDEAGT